MARYTPSLLQVLLALAAHQVAAVPVVLPSSLQLPSGWTSNLPLPTGAKLDPAVHVARDDYDAELPSPSLTSLPTGTFDLSTLSLTLPTSVDLSTLSLTLPGSLTQLPTTLPGSLSLSIDLPTGLSTLTLDKRTLSVPIATATGIPSTLPGLPPLPTGFPTGLPPPTLPTGAPEYPGGLLQPDN